MTNDRFLSYFMSQQTVIQVARYTSLIHCKHLEGILHAIKRRGLPHKVHREIPSSISRYAHIATQLQPYLLSKTYSDEKYKA